MAYKNKEVMKMEWKLFDGDPVVVKTKLTMSRIILKLL